MPGGLLQLVAYGIQDFILTGDPQITFFKKAYRRNTLFSSEVLNLKFSGDQDFDRVSTCNIPNNGDLLGKSVLQIDLPKISCYQIQKDSKVIDLDNTLIENQILKKIQLINDFLDKKIKELPKLLFLKSGSSNDDIIKEVYDLNEFMIENSLNFTNDEIEYIIDNRSWSELDGDVTTKENLKKILLQQNELEESDVGNFIHQKKIYNPLLNNFYFSIIKLSTNDQYKLEYLNFLDLKLKTFYNKHILNSYDIASQINDELEKKILIDWYKNKVVELNSNSSTEPLSSNEYNLNFTINSKISNNINDYNSIINDQIEPTSFKSDLELSYSYGKEIYSQTINKNKKISNLLEDTLNINYLVIKSLINLVYHPDLKLTLYLKYNYNPNVTTDKVGDQSLIYSDSSKWTKFYNKLFNLYDENNNKITLTQYNIPIKNLLETKFIQFRSEIDNIMKNISYITVENADEFFKFTEFLNLRATQQNSVNFNDEGTYGIYDFSINYQNNSNYQNLTDTNKKIYYNSSDITEWIGVYTSNLYFIDFNSFIYLNIQNKNNDNLNYISNETYVKNIHSQIYSYIYSKLSDDNNDLLDISSNNTAFTYICSIIDFDQLFTTETIIDNYVNNIISYKYKFNIDINLISRKDKSKHILKTIKTYTIDSSWFTFSNQNNQTIIKINNLFNNRSFYYNITNDYKLEINNQNFDILIFKGNYPYEGTDKIELTIDSVISNIDSLKIISEKSSIINLTDFSSGTNNETPYYSSIYIQDSRIIIDRINDILTIDDSINDINQQVYLDTIFIDNNLIEKEDDTIYSRDSISQYLGLSFNQSLVNLFDEKLKPIFKIKLNSIAETYKYYQIVDINRKALEVYKTFFDNFISELSETVGLSSYNFYNLLSEKNKALSASRINNELNNIVELTSKGNIYGDINPTNIIQRNLSNTNSPPLYEYELVEEDKIIVENENSTYNFNVLSVSSTQVILDQKFDFDKEAVEITKQKKYIKYGGGYLVNNNTISGIGSKILSNSQATFNNSNNKIISLNSAISNHNEYENSLIQIVPLIKKTNLLIINVNQKSISISGNPNNIVKEHQKIYTKDNQLIGTIKNIVSINDNYSLNLKEIPIIDTSNIINNNIYTGVRSIRKISQTNSLNLTSEERFFNKSINVKEIREIIPSEIVNDERKAVYLDSVFRKLISANIKPGIVPTLLNNFTTGANTTIQYQLKPNINIDNYIYNLENEDKILIYGTEGLTNICDTGLTFNTNTTQSPYTITLNQNINNTNPEILPNSKIYNQNKELVAIVREINNSTLTLDDNGMLISLASGDKIFTEQDINTMYSLNVTTLNGTTTTTLKDSDNINSDIDTTNHTLDLDQNSGRIYKIANKKNLIKNVDKMSKYNLMLWNQVLITTNPVTFNLYIKNRKPVNTNLTPDQTYGVNTTGEITLDIPAGSSLHSLTKYSMIYKSDGTFIGRVKTITEDTQTQGKIIVDGLQGTVDNGTYVELAQTDQLYVLNNISNTHINTSQDVLIQTTTAINVDLNGESLSNLDGKHVYKLDNTYIGKVTSISTSNINNTITFSGGTFVEIKATDKLYIATEMDIDVFNFKLPANIDLFKTDDTPIGQMSSNQFNKFTCDNGIETQIEADTELFFSSNRLRIKTESNHIFDIQDKILINNLYESTNLTLENKLNNNKYEIMPLNDNTFNIVKSYNYTNSFSVGDTLYNVYGQEIGVIDTITNNSIKFNSTIKTDLHYGDEVFKLDSTNNNILIFSHVIVSSNYNITKDTILVSNVANLNSTYDYKKGGKLLRIIDNNEKTASLLPNNNMTKLTITGDHNLNQGDIIVIYGVPKPDVTTGSLYDKINKQSFSVFNIVNNNTFEININSTSLSNNNTTCYFYKLPIPELMIDSITTVNQISTIKFNTEHNYLDGDRIIIYESKKTDNTDLRDLNKLWIVKKVSTTEINIVYHQDFNYDILKIINNYDYGGIVVKVGTSNIIGVNFTKYVNYNDIIAIEINSYNSTDNFYNKFTRIQYRGIKNITDNFIELEEFIDIPDEISNTDLIKYELPNFSNDIAINSTVRVKIGNIYENKIVTSILSDHQLEVESNFSSNIDYYVDLNIVVFSESTILNQIFDLNFRKLFLFNSNTFNGELFFEKTGSSINYNNWKKVRYYDLKSDLTNNPNNYDMYNYSNKLIELNNLHWKYYQENYKILKIKAFTPDVYNYTKSLSELIILIDKIIYDFVDKKYKINSEIQINSSSNYNTEYYIDNFNNPTTIESNDRNILQISVDKNLNQYNLNEKVKWSKPYQIRFLDFLNQKIKIADNLNIRLNKKFKLNNSRVNLEEYDSNIFQYNCIEGFEPETTKLELVEKINDNKYSIIKEDATITKNNLDTYIKFSKKLDNKINQNLYISGTNKVFIKEINNSLISIEKNKYNSKLLDKIYLSKKINNINMDFNLTFKKQYNLIIYRVDEKMIYIKNLVNNFNLINKISSGDYLRFKIDDNIFVRQVLKVVNESQIELMESLLISKYFVDETNIEINKAEGYDTGTSQILEVKGDKPTRFFNNFENIFNSNGNIVGQINAMNDTNNTITLRNSNNLIRLEHQEKLYFETIKFTNIEVLNYNKLNKIEEEVIKIKGLVSFDDDKIIGNTNSNFSTELAVNDCILIKTFDNELSLENSITVISTDVLEIKENLDKVDLTQDFVLTDTNNYYTIKKIHTIGINKYHLYLDQAATININLSFKIYYTSNNLQYRNVKSIENNTNLKLDKSPIINSLKNVFIHKIFKFDKSDYINLGKNIDVYKDYFVYSDIKKNLAINNLVKIKLNNNSFTYFARISNFDLNNNKVYFKVDFEDDISYFNSNTTHSASTVEKLEFYGYNGTLEDDYPEDNKILDELNCIIEVDANQNTIKSSKTSYFNFKLKIGDEIYINGQNQNYKRKIINIGIDQSNAKEILYLNQNIPEAINKSNVLYKLSNRGFEIPYDNLLVKESRPLVLKGKVNVTTNNNIVEGINTNFLTEVKLGDTIMINFNENFETAIVYKILSKTQIEVDHNFKFTGSDLYISKYLTLSPEKINGDVNLNENNLIEGINTKFISNLSIGDFIKIKNENDELIRRVTYIYSDKLLEVDENVEIHQIDMEIYKISLLEGFYLDNQIDIDKFNLNIQIKTNNNYTKTNNSTKISVEGENPIQYLSFGDKIINGNGHTIGIVTHVDQNSITFKNGILEDLGSNDSLYLPNKINLNNKNIQKGSCLKINDSIVNVSNIVNIYNKIKTGCLIKNISNSGGISKLELKTVIPSDLIRKGSIILDGNEEVIGQVTSLNFENSNNEIYMILLKTVYVNQEIFVADIGSNLILEKPLINNSNLLVNQVTLTNGKISSLTYKGTNIYLNQGTNLFNMEGDLLGIVNSIDSNNNTIQISFGSSISLIEDQPIYYNINSEKINNIDLISNSIINSTVEVISNSDIITFENDLIKPNLNINDYIIIDNQILCKILNFDYNFDKIKIQLSKKINISTSSKTIRKVQFRLLPLIHKNNNKLLENKYFEIDYHEIVKKVLVGNIIYNDVLDTSENFNFYLDGIIPIKNLFANDQGFISSSASEYDVFPLDRTVTFNNKVSNLDSNNNGETNFRYVQIQINDLFNIEEYNDYPIESEFNNKIIEIKKYQIESISFTNANISNNWKKKLYFKIETNTPEEVDLDFNSKISINQNNNLIEQINQINESFLIPDVVETNIIIESVINLTNTINLENNDNTLIDLQVGNSIYKNNIYITSIVEIVSSTQIKVTSINNLSSGDKLNINNFKNIDSVNKIYNIRNYFTSYRFNINYDYKILIFNEYDHLINQYYVTSIEEINNKNEIRFSTDNLIKEINFKDSENNKSGYIPENLRFEFITINTYQLELPSTGIDNKNNILIQESNYKIEQVEQIKVGINQEFSFTDQDIFNIVNPVHYSYLTLNELFEIISEEFKRYNDYNFLFYIFKDKINLSNLFLISNLTYLKSHGEINTDLANYDYYNDYNGILLNDETVDQIFEKLKSDFNLKIINNDIQFINIKLNQILVDLVFKNNFIGMENVEQDELIEKILTYIQSIYKNSINNTYHYKFNLLLTEAEKTSIENQNIIPSTLNYDSNILIKSITKIDSIYRIELDQEIDNVNGFWSIQEDSSIYYSVKKIEKRDTFIFYLEMNESFEIDSSKTYNLKNSDSIINLDKDWNKENVFIATLNSIPSFHNQIIILEEYNINQLNIINNKYYLSEINVRDLKKNQIEITNGNINLNMVYRLVSSNKLNRINILPSEFKIIDDKLVRRIKFDTTQISSLNNSSVKVNNNYNLGDNTIELVNENLGNLSNSDLIFNKHGTFIGKITNITNNIITVNNDEGILIPLENQELIFKDAEFYGDIALNELITIYNNLQNDIYKKHTNHIKDLKKIVQLLNFDQIIYYVKNIQLKSKIRSIITNYIKIPSEEVGSDFLFNLNEYHIKNLINYLYFYYAKNSSEIDYFKLFDLNNMVDNDTSNRYLLDISSYNIEFNRIKQIKLYAFIENSDFTTSDYTETGLILTNYYQNYDNPYNLIIRFDRKIIDLERDPYYLGTNKTLFQTPYLEITLIDDTIVYIEKDLYYIKDDNIKINYNIELNNYQEVSQDSNITIEYKYLNSAKKENLEILKSNSINNLDCNLPDLINQDDKINIKHTYFQPILNFKIEGYFYKFYFRLNTDLDFENHTYELSYGSNKITIIKQYETEENLILDILSDSIFVSQKYYFLKSSVYFINKYESQIIEDVKYDNKLRVKYELNETDNDYLNCYIIKIDNVFRKVENVTNIDVIEINEVLNTSNLVSSSKIQVNYLKDLLLVKDYNQSANEIISSITIDDNIVTGQNTYFQDQLKENDLILIDETYIRQVTKINSQTEIEVNENLSITQSTNLQKIYYISIDTGNVISQNTTVTSTTHNLGTYYYYPIYYLEDENNQKLPIRSIESSYIKINGRITKENNNNLTLIGTNTIFTQDLEVGDKIRLKTKYLHYETRRITSIISDTELTINLNINNFENDYSEIYKINKILGQVKISGDEYNIIEGTNTKFTKELRVSDFIRIEVNGYDYVKQVKQIDSDTYLIIDGTFNHTVTELTNCFIESNGYILNLSNNFDYSSKEFKILKEERLFFEDTPLSNDYSGLVEFQFENKLNIDESHSDEFNFLLKSYNPELLNTYKIKYYTRKSQKVYSFLIKNVNLDSSLTWKLNYDNVLSGYKTYDVDKINLSELKEYVYQINVSIGLDFSSLNPNYQISFSNIELTESDNTSLFYHQISKQEFILIKETSETIPISGNYFMILKNEYEFTEYSSNDTTLELKLDKNIVFYSDVDNYKHKYYIIDENENFVSDITNIVDQESNYNYKITLSDDTSLELSKYKLIHLRQLKIESINNYYKDRTIDIQFKKDIFFLKNNQKNSYGEIASQYLSGSNQLDFNSKIYKFDCLGERLFGTNTYNINKSDNLKNESGESYYFFSVNILDLTNTDLEVGDNILFYDNMIEYNARVRLIEQTSLTGRNIYLDKIYSSFENVIIYKYSKLNFDLDNTTYSINYGYNQSFDQMTYYDGSGKRNVFFTTKTPLVRECNIIKIVDSDDSTTYYRFVKSKTLVSLTLEEYINKTNIEADIYINKTNCINFIDQDYSFTIVDNKITLDRLPNSELNEDDVVIINNQYIRIITQINEKELTINENIPNISNKTYFNITKIYYSETLLGRHTYVTVNQTTIVNASSTEINLENYLTINSITDVSKNIYIDELDKYPVVRIDNNFDYLNRLHINKKLNEFKIDRIEFIEKNLDGIYIKLIIQNVDDFSIDSNKSYLMYDTIKIIPKYKEFNGNFPLDLSLYKSESFSKHTFLINSLNKRKISDNFLVVFNDNIININNKLKDNLEAYKKDIEKNKKSIQPIKTSEKQLELGFIKNIGHYIIDYIEFYIGEQRIDKHTGEWLDMYHQLFTNHNSQFNKIVGNIPELINYDKTPKGNYRLYIPLQFWFCQKAGLALPLIALHNNSIKIKLKLNKLENCIIYPKNGILKSDGNVKLSLLAEYYYLEETERKLFGESKHEYLIERMQIRHPEMITQKSNNIKIEFDDAVKDLFWVIKSEKNLINKQNTVYCDYEDEIDYDLYQKEYIDNLKIYNIYKTANTPIELIPNSFQETYNIFSNLNSITLENYFKEKYLKYCLLFVKEEIDATWIYQANTNYWQSSNDHNLELNDVILFTTNGGGASNYLINKPYYVIKVVDSKNIQLSSTYKGNEFKGENDSIDNWIAIKINNGIVNQNNSYNRYKKHIKKNEKVRKFYHLFDKGALKIFSRKITSDKDANYYNYIQTQNYKKSPDQGIYVHNFSLYPLEYQPSGSCNFSLTEDTRLEFEATDRISIDNPASLRIFARTYNILRVMSGFGGLAFYK